MRFIFIVVALALFLPTQGRAQGSVYCSNCSTVWDQATSIAKQIQQLAQELQIAQNTLSFYTNAIQNTVNLPSSVYRDLTGDVQRMAAILHQAEILGDNATRMLQNLTAPNGYPVSNVQNWQQQFALEHTTCANSINQDSQLLSIQASQLSSDASSLGMLHSELMGVAGRQQSLQSIGGVLSTLSQLISKLHGTSLGGSNRSATCETARRDRQALLDKYDQVYGPGGDQLAGTCMALAQVGGSVVPECQ